MGPRNEIRGVYLWYNCLVKYQVPGNEITKLLNYLGKLTFFQVFV